MLIRSQNKQKIFSINSISGIEFDEYYNTSLPYQMYALANGREYLLGKYSTKEKAVKTLDMIQEKYEEFMTTEENGVIIGILEIPKVFQMPQDDEV